MRWNSVHLKHHSNINDTKSVDLKSTRGCISKIKHSFLSNFSNMKLAIFGKKRSRNTSLVSYIGINFEKLRCIENSQYRMTFTRKLEIFFGTCYNCYKFYTTAFIFPIHKMYEKTLNHNHSWFQFRIFSRINMESLTLWFPIFQNRKISSPHFQP